MFSSRPKLLPLFEAIAMFAGIFLYIWLLRRRFPLVWVILLALVVASQAAHHETPGSLGFRRVNLRACLERFTPVLALFSLALLAAGAIGGTIRAVTPESALMSLLLYCLWGLFQQYLLDGYFVNRFAEFSPDYAPILAALLFSAIHLPNWFLMAVTLIGGYVCARVYLRFRNLYALGLAHGVVGFLLYLCVPDTISHHLYVGPKWFS